MQADLDQVLMSQDVSTSECDVHRPRKKGGNKFPFDERIIWIWFSNDFCQSHKTGLEKAAPGSNFFRKLTYKTLQEQTMTYGTHAYENQIWHWGNFLDNYAW